MDKYLKTWLDIISKMANDNTYKLAWGRGIIDCITSEKYTSSDNYIEIGFYAISEKILKYYWNQGFFFQLKQGPNRDKPPVIYQIAEEVIQHYKNVSQSTIPIWYDRAEPILSKDQEYYKNIMKKLIKALKQDVCWRFLNINGVAQNVYELNRKEEWIRISHPNKEILKEYGVILTQLLNYKWTQLLEQFNRSPKIASKIRGSQENSIRRKSLSKYKDLLLKQFEDGIPIDFYTGMTIEVDNISIDHVIPWSFIYSDDIWNLVITSKSYNSQKSNSIPHEQDINKLIIRNERLVKLAVDKHMHESISEAIHNKYVQKYYADMQI